MRGHKKGTNIDWDNIKEDDVERLLLLSASSFFSFISLVKTSYSVNIPDPDPRRTQLQCKENAKFYKLTLILFNFFCILYRIIGIAFFCVYIKKYTVILIITGFLVNLVALHRAGASPTISIILGAISLFVPNGYILYNFAGTLVVDFTRNGSMIVFLVSTIAPNIIWACGIVAVAIYTGTSGLSVDNFTRDPVTEYKFVVGMNISLGVVGIISTILGLIHWFLSVEKLFLPAPQEKSTELAPTDTSQKLDATGEGHGDHNIDTQQKDQS